MVFPLAPCHLAAAGRGRSVESNAERHPAGLNLNNRLSWGIACLLAAILASAAVGQKGVTACASCSEWNKPQRPFLIFGNTYYVGPRGLSSILITSKSGHVLIDGALPESAAQVAANIRSLGLSDRRCESYFEFSCAFRSRRRNSRIAAVERSTRNRKQVECRCHAKGRRGQR